MVDIAPFRALRPFQKGLDISPLICPPYDVISLEERAGLVKKSEKNIVQIELPEGDGAERYTNANEILEKWRAQGHLQEDRTSSFYLLETVYRIDDPMAPKTPLKRYGVLAALRLEPPGKGAVKPHEKTLPKAKEERLKLLRAVETHVSPIFGLFFDEKKLWPLWIRSILKTKPVAVGRETPTLGHRLWKVDNPDFVKSLRLLLKGNDLFIADGHHRYEVSWAYREERLTHEPGPKAGQNFVMAYLCPMEEPGLLMLPTHRLVLSDKSFEAWVKHLEKFFRLKPVSSWEDLFGRLNKRVKGERVMGWAHKKGLFVLEGRDDFSPARCLTNRATALQELDVVLLHDLVMEEAAGKVYTKDKDLVYTRDIQEIKKAIKANAQWSAFILGSAGIAALASVARAGEVMPPKTTYFYPKVPTGFVMMPLKQEIR